MKMIMKRPVLLLSVIVLAHAGICQNAVSNFNFIDYQRSFPRINEMVSKREDSLIRQFQEKGLTWPAKYIYLRSFKYDSQLEVWVKSDRTEKFKLFKTYKVCALSGSLGPKRMQGDYQVPEGFYYINEFNPKSVYYLSLGLNYPNASDRILGDSLQPGGDIYIHGSCVTTGCIPITNQQIEELYILAAHAKSMGQDFIPVHIFPVQFKNPRSVNFLNKYLRDYPEYNTLLDELKHAYAYFDKTKELPLVMIDRKGDYKIDGVIPADPLKEEKIQKRRESRPMKHFDEDDIAKVVDKLPGYPGGIEKFQAFLDETSREMVRYLSDDQTKTYIMVEFIIDQNGKPANARVIKGGNDELNEKLEEKFDNMPDWTPAIRKDKNVVIRLKQSLYVEKPEKIEKVSS